MPYHASSTQSEIQRPVSNLFILLTLFAALLLNGLRWEGVWLAIRPDFVAVVALYWCTYKPLRVGIGISWAVGMLADVADASLFGQHALAYTLLGFGGVMLHRRLQMFSLRQQMTQVFGIFVLTYTVYAVMQWLVNGHMVWWYFIGSVTSTLFWAPLSIVLQAIRQRPMDRE